MHGIDSKSENATHYRKLIEALENSDTQSVRLAMSSHAYENWR